MKIKNDINIYVVDDDINNLDIIDGYLSSKKYKVKKENNPHRAMEHIRQEGTNYDLFILDWMMPDIDGIEILTFIKNNENLQRIPVILQTAKSSPAEIRTGYDLGAVQYLTKPFDSIVLKAMVKNVLEESSKNITAFETSKTEIEFIKKYASDMIDKKEKETKLDLLFYQTLHQFFLRAQKIKSSAELKHCLVDTIEAIKFGHPLASDNPKKNSRICCLLQTHMKELYSIDKTDISENEIEAFNLACKDNKIVKSGNKVALSSESRTTAVFLEHLPLKSRELDKGLQCVEILLEMFDCRFQQLEANSLRNAQMLDLKQKTTEYLNWFGKQIGLNNNHDENLSQSFLSLREKLCSLFERKEQK
ncbi:MAG: response regulator [Deltaproteobacteria bacterium]|nr:response regulator [Deltaproteobacteria bacterium]